MKQSDSLTKPTEPKMSALENRIRRQTWWLALDRFWQNNQEPLTLWFSIRIALLIFPFFLAALFPMAVSSDVVLPFNNPTADLFIGSWTRWDAVHYLAIAGEGYTGLKYIAFYPLYPLLVRITGTLINPFDASNIFSLSLAGIIVSSLAVLALCLLFYKLTALEYDQKTARFSLLYLLIFPTGFFLWTVYTESLFLALAVGAFYFARTNRWLIAMILVAGCILTKNQGMFVPIALLIEYAGQIKWNIRKIDRCIFYFVIPVLAFGGWLIINWVIYGYPLQFLKASSEEYDRYFEFPWVTIAKGAELYDAKFLIFFLPVTLVAIWAVLKGKLRFSYFVLWLCFLLQALIMPIRNQELYAVSRYLLLIFPVFFLLGIAGNRSRVFHYTYSFLSLCVFSGLLVRFILWYWVA
jgi:Mannosyltransferase (PIG-V)